MMRGLRGGDATQQRASEDGVELRNVWLVPRTQSHHYGEGTGLKETSVKEPWHFLFVGIDEIAGGILVSEVWTGEIALSHTLSYHSRFVNRTTTVTTKSKNSHSIFNSRLPPDRNGVFRLADEPDGDFGAPELVLLFHIIPETFLKENIAYTGGVIQLLASASFNPEIHAVAIF